MRYQRGQALVLVLLSLAVVLTLVLFVLARSTTDVAVSSRSEEAARAFSAAEAGIENSLVIGVGGSGDVGNASYTADVTSFAEGSTQFNYPIDLYSGDSMTTWFASHNDDGTINTQFFTGSIVKICWGRDGTPADDTSPAVEVSIFYEDTPGSPASTQIARGAFDPYSGRSPTNNFASAGGAGCSIDGVNYAFQESIPLNSLGVNTAGLLFARVRMFYNTDPHPVGIAVTGGNLPSQGQDISSSGVAGDSNRKVQVFQAWPEAPPIFDYAIYSSGGLTK